MIFTRPCRLFCGVASGAIGDSVTHTFSTPGLHPLEHPGEQVNASAVFLTVLHCTYPPNLFLWLIRAQSRNQHWDEACLVLCTAVAAIHVKQCKELWLQRGQQGEEEKGERRVKIDKPGPWLLIYSINWLIVVLVSGILIIVLVSGSCLVLFLFQNYLIDDTGLMNGFNLT